jgi:hypothetical protein
MGNIRCVGSDRLPGRLLRECRSEAVGLKMSLENCNIEISVPLRGSLTLWLAITCDSVLGLPCDTEVRGLYFSQEAELVILRMGLRRR